jgi:hypothetical protein
MGIEQDLGESASAAPGFKARDSLGARQPTPQFLAQAAAGSVMGNGGLAE